MFIPIVTFCMVQGSCAIWSGIVHETEEECAVVIEAVKRKLDSDKDIKSYIHRCAPIRFSFKDKT